MSLLVYLLFGLALTWLAYVGYSWVASQSLKGQPVDQLLSEFPAISAAIQPVVLYWYSPNCAPCRRMSPVIDELIAEDQPVIKLNIAERVDTARQVGIRAAPTLMRIHNGVIDEVLLGAQSRARILALLQQGQ